MSNANLQRFDAGDTCKPRGVILTASVSAHAMRHPEFARNSSARILREGQRAGDSSCRRSAGLGEARAHSRSSCRCQRKTADERFSSEPTAPPPVAARFAGRRYLSRQIDSGVRTLCMVPFVLIDCERRRHSVPARVITRDNFSYARFS
jgi:hypothetical protein